jgi:hypothetical protein
VKTGDDSIEPEAPPTVLPPQQPSRRKRKCLPSSEQQLAVDTAVKIQKKIFTCLIINLGL